MKVKVLEGGTMPTYGSDEAAGLDLYARIDYTMLPWHLSHKTHRIPVGVQIEMDKCQYGLICGRSGLANNHSVLAHTGIIDSDYRGEINALLINMGGEPYVIKKGDRVAQLVVHWIPPMDVIQVDELDITDRADGGLGSTGR